MLIGKNVISATIFLRDRNCSSSTNVSVIVQRLILRIFNTCRHCGEGNASPLREENLLIFLQYSYNPPTEILPFRQVPEIPLEETQHFFIWHEYSFKAVILGTRQQKKRIPVESDRYFQSKIGFESPRNRNIFTNCFYGYISNQDCRQGRTYLRQVCLNLKICLWHLSILRMRSGDYEH